MQELRWSHPSTQTPPLTLKPPRADSLTKTWCPYNRQKGCTEQDDLLRPYSSLDYAWDEPALPHKLLLELPGNRRLGEYDLDNVGHHWFVNVAATSQRAEQRIMVCVRADGPKRVLDLVDLLVCCHRGATLLCISAFSLTQHLAGCDLSSVTWPSLLEVYPGILDRAAVVTYTHFMVIYLLSFRWLHSSGNACRGDQSTGPNQLTTFTCNRVAA